MAASANDMVVVADINEEEVLDAVMEKVEEFLKKQATAAEGKKVLKALNLGTAH
jgi:hypothetical protein